MPLPPDKTGWTLKTAIDFSLQNRELAYLFQIGISADERYLYTVFNPDAFSDSRTCISRIDLVSKTYTDIWLRVFPAGSIGDPTVLGINGFVSNNTGDLFLVAGGQFNFGYVGIYKVSPAGVVSGPIVTADPSATDWELDTFGMGADGHLYVAAESASLGVMKVWKVTQSGVVTELPALERTSGNFQYLGITATSAGDVWISLIPDTSDVNYNVNSMLRRYRPSVPDVIDFPIQAVQNPATANGTEEVFGGIFVSSSGDIIQAMTAFFGPAFTNTNTPQTWFLSINQEGVSSRIAGDWEPSGEGVRSAKNWFGASTTPVSHIDTSDPFDPTQDNVLLVAVIWAVGDVVITPTQPGWSLAAPNNGSDGTVSWAFFTRRGFATDPNVWGFDLSSATEVIASVATLTDITSLAGIGTVRSGLGSVAFTPDDFGVPGIAGDGITFDNGGSVNWAVQSFKFIRPDGQPGVIAIQLSYSPTGSFQAFPRPPVKFGILGGGTVNLLIQGGRWSAFPFNIADGGLPISLSPTSPQCLAAEFTGATMNAGRSKLYFIDSSDIGEAAPYVLPSGDASGGVDDLVRVLIGVVPPLRLRQRGDSAVGGGGAPRVIRSTSQQAPSAPRVPGKSNTYS